MVDKAEDYSQHVYPENRFEADCKFFETLSKIKGNTTECYELLLKQAQERIESSRKLQITFMLWSIHYMI